VIKIATTFAIHTGSQNPFGEGRMAHIKWPHLLCPPKIGSARFLATKHPMDVSTLAGRVMSQPISTPLQDGFGFFHHLTPDLPQHALRLACPKGRRHGVTTFHVSDNRYLRSTLLCRWGCCPCRAFSNPSEPPAYRFGSSLTAPLACKYSRQLQVFTCVDYSILS
jgi:hypothetical protein